MILRDPATGIGAKVNEDQRVAVESSTRSAQSRVSLEDGNAYQVLTVPVAVLASEQTLLLAKNNSKETKMVVTYIRVTSADVDAWNNNAYFRIMLNGDYVSGGAAVDAVNMNTASGKVPVDIKFYSGSTAIVTSGTRHEVDRHPCANDQVAFNKEGAVVIAPGGMMSITHKGSTAVGFAWARISFYLTQNGGA
jgi:hypothetical protein